MSSSHDDIEHAMISDLEGSAILEFLFREQSGSLQGFTDIGRKEIIATVSWYLWWIRRKRTQNEVVPPISICKLSILAIVSNDFRATKPPRDVLDRWGRISK
jgi:hypothetical protein